MTGPDPNPGKRRWEYIKNFLTVHGLVVVILLAGLGGFFVLIAKNGPWQAQIGDLGIAALCAWWATSRGPVRGGASPSDGVNVEGQPPDDLGKEIARGGVIPRQADADREPDPSELPGPPRSAPEGERSPPGPPPP